MTTLAFTRPADRIAESVKMAQEMGFDVLAAPSLEIMDGCQEDYDTVERFLVEGKVDYAIFGSGTAVEKCIQRFGRDKFKELFSKPVIVAIGPTTSSVLFKLGEVEFDVMPVNDYSSYGIIDAIGKYVRGKTALLVRSDNGSDVLTKGLEESGATVIDFPSYRLKAVGMTEDLAYIMDSMDDGSVDVIAFTSPMSAESFFLFLEVRYGKSKVKDIMSNIKIAAIGRPTALKLKSLGFFVDVVPSNTTFIDMLQSIKNVMSFQ